MITLDGDTQLRVELCCRFVELKPVRVKRKGKRVDNVVVNVSDLDGNVPRFSLNKNFSVVVVAVVRIGAVERSRKELEELVYKSVCCSFYKVRQSGRSVLEWRVAQLRRTRQVNVICPVDVSR